MLRDLVLTYAFIPVGTIFFTKRLVNYFPYSIMNNCNAV